MQQKGIRNQFTFTHFLSIPFVSNQQRTDLKHLQQLIFDKFPKDQQKRLQFNNPNLFHLTLSMLTLNNEQKKQQAIEAIKSQESKIKSTLKDQTISLKNVSQFTKKIGKYQNDISIIFLEVEQTDLLTQISDLLIREMIQNEIIDTDDLKAMKIVFDKNHKFRPETFHLTLFRVKNKQKEDELMDISLLNEFKDYNLGQTELKFVDISTRFEYMDDQFYQPLWRIILNQ